MGVTHCPECRRPEGESHKSGCPFDEGHDIAHDDVFPDPIPTGCTCQSLRDPDPGATRYYDDDCPVHGPLVSEAASAGWVRSRQINEAIRDSTISRVRLPVDEEVDRLEAQMIAEAGKGILALRLLANAPLGVREGLLMRYRGEA